ncbi:antibiotic biosynthesis monooxygenase [Romeria aff. gracilis LEGE 07310]|uniref:Antibiotic biosynthesis monooxygenase n=1 Tax=Vasconcelosia minhoensis LEGE 07310 TaxID=915328 RepID=A0A8J7DPW7_9CYAN|nr:antibiotic biosynthesis monooxygenase [Romeria gracilis]MBE9080420.1 antibiotic biosynthesis monooxygenase [Romeria aff. gracilis LEGE 07310]
MSEFSDFLKHKQAYVAIGEFQPGRFAEARQLYEQAVSTYGPRCKGAYLLQEPGSDRGIAVIFWDDISDMSEHQDKIYQKAMQEISALFVKPPEVKIYEVCSEIGLIPEMLAAASR